MHTQIERHAFCSVNKLAFNCDLPNIRLVYECRVKIEHHVYCESLKIKGIRCLTVYKIAILDHCLFSDLPFKVKFEMAFHQRGVVD